MVAITPLLLSLFMNAVLAEKFYALDYSPYRTTKTCASDAEIQQDLEILKELTNTVQIDLLGGCNHEIQVVKIASGLGMKVILQFPILYTPETNPTSQFEALKKTVLGTSDQEHLAIQNVIGPVVESDESMLKSIKGLLDSLPSLSHVKLSLSVSEVGNRENEIFETVPLDNYVLQFPVLLMSFMVTRCNVTENLEAVDESLAGISTELSKKLILGSWGWPSALRDINTNEDLTTNPEIAGIMNKCGHIPNSHTVLINTMLCDRKYKNVTVIWRDAFDRDWDYQEEFYEQWGIAYRNFGMGFANRTIKSGIKEAMSCT